MSKLIKNLGKYVDFTTDFGMKLYFGEENKEVLIAFLNDLFAGEKVIEDLVYLETEHDGETGSDRRVIFDLHCQEADGGFFVIEMQQFRQDFFKDRSVYYTSRLISKQVKKGKEGNGYQLPEVYFIAILEFDFDDGAAGKYFYDVALCDKQTHEIFYNKLGYKFIVLPNFVKEEAELESDTEQWFFLMKNASRLNQLPKFSDKRIFSRVFQIGEVAKLTKGDLVKYEASLKHRRDVESVNNTARRAGMQEGLREGLEKGLQEGLEQGLEKGMEEGMKEGERKKAIEIAIKFKKKGTAIEDIAEGTGLSIEEIEKL